MPKKKLIAAPAPVRKGRGRPGARMAARATSSSRLDGDAPSKDMLIGYARVSTIDQNLALQRDALTEAGCGKIFTEHLSGAVTDRPALRDALEFARSGDTLIVWKLDRLARSMKQLIETIEKLRLRNIGFRSQIIETNSGGQPMTEHELLEEKEREKKAEERRKYFSRILSATSAIIALATATTAIWSVSTKYGTEYLTSEIDNAKYQSTRIQRVQHDLDYLEDHVKKIDETIKSMSKLPEGSA
jgi:hypothetical protein